MTKRTAVIIGAGPAGLTAAIELLRRTDIQPIVVEALDDVGGISRTIEHNGNRIDIGGHRFFSKSDRVMSWWLERLPLQGTDDEAAITLTYQNGRRALAPAAGGPDPEATDRVMLLRRRVSRILYGGNLYAYPLTLSADTLMKLGPLRTLDIGQSYLRAMLRPVRPERSLEDFLVNRFGRVLYLQFFKDYTEKVWGVPCAEISPDWGAQRIKGLSIRKVLGHALRSALPSTWPKALARRADIGQKGTETSLIERFLYPKLGPGQMWRVAAEEVRRLGGEIRMRCQADRLHHAEGRVTAVDIRDLATGETRREPADYVLSTMPVQALMAGLTPAPPAAPRQIAEGLRYRDFITVGVLVDRVELGGGATGRELGTLVPDNWIYIQEPGVKVGRLQLFNNWSPYMVADPARVWLGLEFFCQAGDELWNRPDAGLIRLAEEELERLGIARRGAVIDAVVVRAPKAYPAYFGSYDRFAELQAYLDGFANLYLVGRNGMHRYNNQDHSMLTAMAVVDNIAGGIAGKANIWAVNAEQDYHEEREQDERGQEERAAEAGAA